MQEKSKLEYSGRVKNGVVVVNGSVKLPEGALVTVTLSSPLMYASNNQRVVEFPLIQSSSPGSVHLNNEMINEIFDEEDEARYR